MTCIVGIVDKDGVHLGADSRSLPVNGSLIKNCKIPKIFRHGDLIMGVSGMGRIGDVIRTSLVRPERPAGMEASTYVCSLLVDALRKLLKDHGLLEKSQNSNVEKGTPMIVGIDGQLFTIDVAFGITQPASGFEAIGSGQRPALGSLVTIQNLHLWDKLTTRDKLDLALRASSEIDCGVAPPYTYVSLHQVQDVTGEIMEDAGEVPEKPSLKDKELYLHYVEVLAKMIGKPFHASGNTPGFDSIICYHAWYDDGAELVIDSFKKIGDDMYFNLHVGVPEGDHKFMEFIKHRVFSDEQLLMAVEVFKEKGKSQVA